MEPTIFLDGYTIYPEILEKGTFSVVKNAIRLSDMAVIAIKIVNKNDIPIEFKSFANEYNILMTLDHPNILKMYDIGQTEIYHYAIMPLYSEGDINTYATKHNLDNFSEGVAFHIFEQVLNALEYLHMKNIVHRDIKLENLLISDPKHMDIILIDFGFATYQETNGPYLTNYPGSIAYASPEIVKGIPYDGRYADIWAAGVVLYVLLTGKYPFYGNSFEKSRYNIIYNDPAHNAAWDTLSSCKNLIKWMVLKNPNKRPTIPAIRSHPGYIKMQYNSENNK